MTPHWSNSIVALDACPPGFEWASSQPSLADAWRTCTNGSWMIWLAAKIHGAGRDTPEQVALWHARADCAASVLHIYESKFPNDRRIRDCIQAVRDYADGAIDSDALSCAAYAAYAAAANASAAPAYAANAAYAAAKAANAAAYAAYAVYAAATAAYAAKAAYAANAVDASNRDASAVARAASATAATAGDAAYAAYAVYAAIVRARLPIAPEIKP